MIHHGDCLDVMATFDAESIDAVCTDPPYGLEFMGKEWDSPSRMGGFARHGAHTREPNTNPHAKKGSGNPYGRGSNDVPTKGYSGVNGAAYQQWCEAWAREAFRIAKPGAHLLAFGGTRTYHRLAAAIEDAGWEIRDCLVWAYASGFPKSLDVSKAIDKAAGAERELTRPSQVIRGGLGEDWDVNSSADRPRHDIPATPDAAKWQGWGTALKPAWEPIVLARKPLRGTVAANVLRHGTGALNIDGTRIGYQSSDAATVAAKVSKNPTGNASRMFGVEGVATFNAAGRWPANVILTDPIFDSGVEGVVGGGETTSGSRTGQYAGSGSWSGEYGLVDRDINGDSGTYSRFFLIPKADRAEREPVLGGLVVKQTEGDFPALVCNQCGCRRVLNYRPTCGHDDFRREAGQARQNSHPTVKPLDLMRHLVRLVTPPGGTVLDPFLGSGTTALAAEMEGFAWVGIEREAEYVAIAEARLNGTQRGLGLVG